MTDRSGIPAQLSNAVGRLDPTTGQFREFSLPTPNSGPHGLLEDPDGNIWYTGNAAGLIGKIEPKTGKVTEYKMPDPKARDPHSLVLSRSGLIIFTVQGGGFVGTLDPRTGKVALVALAGGSAPYGIVLNSKDVPFFDEFGTNKIGSLDPKTLKVTEYPLPAAGARPRRITVGRDDTIYYTDYARGYLGHLDPATGKVEEFQSPGGADARPYGITTTSDGAIWYCETGESSRNVLVRFNPETKKMLSWPIPERRRNGPQHGRLEGTRRRGPVAGRKRRRQAGARRDQNCHHALTPGTRWLKAQDLRLKP